MVQHAELGNRRLWTLASLLCLGGREYRIAVSNKKTFFISLAMDVEVCKMSLCQGRGDGLIRLLAIWGYEAPVTSLFDEKT